MYKSQCCRDGRLRYDTCHLCVYMYTLYACINMNVVSIHDKSLLFTCSLQYVRSQILAGTFLTLFLKLALYG